MRYDWILADPISCSTAPHPTLSLPVARRCKRSPLLPPPYNLAPGTPSVLAHTHGLVEEGTVQAHVDVAHAWRGVESLAKCVAYHRSERPADKVVVEMVESGK